MSRSLAFLPQEALALITALLPAHDALKLLLLCGSSGLSAKLYAGGLDTLRLTHAELPWSLCESVMKLRLRSLSVESRGCNLIRLKYLVQHLSPSLLRLSINHADVMQILQDESVDLEPLVPLLSCPHLPWNIGQSLPNLDTLHISGMRKATLADLGTNFQLKFVLCLPKSLTDLRIRGLGKRCNVDLWPLLPPHLTNLSHMLGLSSSRLPATLHHSLRSLNVRTLPDMAQSDNEPDFPWTLISRTPQLIFPNSLTALVLQTENLTSLAHFPAFPETLTDLNWVTDDTVINHPAHVFELLPVGLKSLVLSGFESRSGTHASTFLLPSVSVAIINIEMAANAAIAASLYDYVKMTFPNATFFHYRHKGNNRGLGAADLAHHGPTLRTLRASLALDLWHSPSLLASICPNLTSLTLFNRAITPFTFAAIPPTVTYLNLGGLQLSTLTLNLIPPSVTRLIVRAMTLHVNPELAPCLDALPPPPNGGPYIQTNMTINRIVTYKPNPYKATPGASHFLLATVPSGSDPDGFISFLDLDWNLISFPNTLTSLSISHPMKELQNRIGPLNLPHLETLTLDYKLNADPSIRLEELTTLRALHIFNMLGTATTKLPPHLTRLAVKTLKMPPDHHPLPTSLTELSCGQLEPFTAVTPLVNLRVFAADNLDANTLELVELLPESPIEELSLPANGEYADALALIISRFKALRKLSISFCSRYSKLVSTYHAPHISIQEWSPITNPGALAKLAGFTPGSTPLLIYRGDTHLELMRRMASSPQCGKFESIPHHDDFELMRRLASSPESYPHLKFDSLCPYLSQGTKELDLMQLDSHIGSWPESSCEGLEKLTATLLDPLTFDPSTMPRSLLSLDLNSILDTEATFRALPRTLTHLRLRAQKVFSLASARVLPPKLLHLCLPLLDASNDVLAALPTSLQLLEIQNRQTNFDLTLLPTSLKVLYESLPSLPWPINEPSNFAYGLKAHASERFLVEYRGNPLLLNLYSEVNSSS